MQSLINNKPTKPQSEIPTVLADADVLVLCRPVSQQAKYGLPTKLAEYLAVARPVITTVTSDIGYYLQDRHSAYLTPPGDVEAFSEAIISAASGPAERELIGRNGWYVAERYLNAKTCGAEFALWIDCFIRKDA